MKIRSNRLKRAVMTALVVLIAFVVGGQIVVDRMLVGGSDELADQSKLWLATSRKALDLAQLTKEIELNLVQVQQFLTDVSATRGLDGLNDGFDLAKENAAAFARNVAAARGLASDLKADQIIGTLDGLTAAFPGFYDVGQKMARAYVADGPEGGNRIMGEFDGQAEALGAAVEATKSSMSDLLTRIDAEAQAGESALNGSNATAKTIAMVIAGVTMLLGVGIALFIRRSLLTPLGHAIDSLDRLADGEDVPDLAGIDRKDEMGDLARAFASFKRAGAEKTRIEAEAKAAREAQVAERERQMAAEQAKAEELKGFVHDIEAGFERLAEGDLTVRMERPVAEEFEPIRAQFNQSTAALEETLGGVMTGVSSIRTGLDEINTASNDLAQRTEQQAASLEQTVAALSEVTRGVNVTAEGAARAQSSAQTAQKNAEKGGEIVGRAVEAMHAIEQSSEQIGKIIGVIDEIAFQTNLLALNAGVEAARAGEAGKGFAVVAQEVRGLAQRSAEAAKEIKDLISTSSSQVEEGVELVSASGKSLEEIVAQVAAMSSEVSEIARSAREQAANLKEVSAAADQMDKVTQQNAAMVEEATAAAQTLANETDELARLISRFRTAASSGHQQQARRAASRPSAAAPARPAAKPAAASAPRPVAQLKTVGTGGAARKPAAAEDGWEEF